MEDFTGQRFVVTGTASGIGAAVARKLIEAGAEIVSLDRNQPTVPVGTHIPVDLADEASLAAAVQRIDGEFDGLLQVAGVPGTVDGPTVFAVNFLAVRQLTEALTGRIRRGGSIVIVGSTAGFGWPERLDAINEVLATPGYAAGAKWFLENTPEGNAYNFAKECVTVYTMASGIALAPKGIRINAVLPGPVETPILPDFEATMGKDVLDGVRQALGRHGTPDDIADAVLFLADDGARWVNGHGLIVDGGISGAVQSGVVPAPEI